MNKDFTMVCDSASASDLQKSIHVCDALKGGVDIVKELGNKGFTCDAAALKRVFDSDPEYKDAVSAWAKDAGFELGDANIDALGQFFMVWNESVINRLYRGRTAATTFGVKAMGDWLTEKVVFKTRELTAPKAGQYDDFARPAYVGYKYGYDTRDTIRLEWGLEVTKREEMVGSVMRRNPYKDKKDALVLAQSIWENNFFWNGTTADSKKLYGVLNDPGLTTKTCPATSDKDISNTPDVSLVIATLRQFKTELTTALNGNGDADTLKCKILCPLSWQQQFTITNTYMGYTPNKWMEENWKNATIEFKPELDKKCIVFAENVPDVGLDTVNLVRTSALRLVGAMPSLKGREEAYSSSVAGCLIAAPMGIRVWGSLA